MTTIRKGVTLESVKQSASDTVYYSSRTIWWTDDPADLRGDTLPLDAFGAPLFQGSKEDFLKAALSKPDHYGSCALNAFMASHAKNFNAHGEDPKLFTDFKHLNHELAIYLQDNPSFTLIS